MDTQPVMTAAIPAAPAAPGATAGRLQPDRFFVPTAPAHAMPPRAVPHASPPRAVTCSGPGAATSTVAAMLARCLAQEGSRMVGLVDADLAQAGGGLDVLLGLDEDEGWRWHDVHAPLGQLDGAALRRRLPHWEGVDVLAYHPWQEAEQPQWFELQAAIEALGRDGTIVADMGRGTVADQVPALIEAPHVVVVPLSVLGLARARAHLRWLEGIARRSLEQRGHPPRLGQPMHPMVDRAGRVVAVVGVEPAGGHMVPLADACEHLGVDVLGPLRQDRHLRSDMLDGLGLRALPRRHARIMHVLAATVRRAWGPEGGA